MEKGYNNTLEFTFDTLLKVFNYNNVPYMKKYYFYKLMNIVDTRLQKQGVDIGYPEYWYMYGPVTDFELLDGIIDHGFIDRYYTDGENVIYPSKHRRSYDIDPQEKRIIESTIKAISEQYMFKPGDEIKAECYKLNSPHKFNTTFQEFIQVVDNQNQTLIPKNILILDLLDRLLAEFPLDVYPEIEDFYLEWDDTTRLVLSLEDVDLKMELIKLLKGKFWPTYSKGVRLKVNKHIPPEIIAQWSTEYENAILQQYCDIEQIRESLILKDDAINTEQDEDIVKSLMETAYYLDC
jgi:hypothetical protein